MADVLRKVITANSFKNGTAVVSIDMLGNLAKHTINAAVNQTSQIAVMSGVLDSRLDDVRYYSGDTSS